MVNPAVATVSIKKVNSTGYNAADDLLAIEEPLEISIVFGPANNRVHKAISITMRTPGSDDELAAGFLFTEGIVTSAHEIEKINTGFNTASVVLSETIVPDIARLERNFYTTSSCGVCGKSSIDAVKTFCRTSFSIDNTRLNAAVLHTLPAALQKQQNIFKSTGGLHASALFDTEGNLLQMREDVGRHNALDKLIGYVIMNGGLDFDHKILLLSGRASFELIQKAAMAGIKIVAAVGAPSSLAVQMASEWGITLVGFLRDNRFNIYSGEQRIIFDQ